MTCCSDVSRLRHSDASSCAATATIPRTSPLGWLAVFPSPPWSRSQYFCGMLRGWQRCSRLSPVPARLLTRSAGRTLATISGSPEAGVADPAAYCRDLVRTRDYESYLIGSFYPRELQGAFFALRAFYVSKPFSWRCLRRVTCRVAEKRRPSLVLVCGCL